jgi:glutaredoxin
MNVSKLSPLKRCAPLGLALLLCAAGASAQMFKWTDAKGVVHFSDRPPAEDIKVETKSFSGGGSDVALPYELARAARAHPVTLYTTTDCNVCDQGRALLKQRGIPFVEKTVLTSADQQKLKDAGGAGQLPLLVVGGARQVGFETTAWNDTLNHAAYPKRSMLPSTYRYPAVTAAAPERVLAREESREEARDAGTEREGARKQAPAPSSTTPPGFRF